MPCPPRHLASLPGTGPCAARNHRPAPRLRQWSIGKVIGAFLVGAFVVIAVKAYEEQARAYEAAPQSVKAACAGRPVGDYRHCVVREDAARRAIEQQ